MTVEDFHRRIAIEIGGIRQRLRAGNYRFQRLFPVAKPKDGGKFRPILVPAVCDRVVQRAIYDVVYPVLRPHVDCPNSHAFLRGTRRGVPSAVRQVCDEVTGGKRIVLIVDIEDFFGSIDSGRLFADVVAELPDDSLTPLLQQLQSWEIHELGALPKAQQGCFPRPGAGIPQGSILSPLLANYYLRDFDREAQREGITAIRYADDIAVACETLADADRSFAWMRDRLRSLGLTIHTPGTHKKSRLVEDARAGLDYLGFHIRGDSSGQLRVRPGQAAVARAEGYIGDLLDAGRREGLAERYTALTHFVSGWLSTYGQVCDTSAESARLLDHTQRALERLMRAHGFVASDAGLTSRQRRLLGVNDLFEGIARRVERRRPQVDGTSVLAS